MKTDDSSDPDLKKYTRLISRVPDFERRYGDIANKYALEQRFPPHQRVAWKKLVNNQFPNTFENNTTGRKEWLWLVTTHRTLLKNQEEKVKRQAEELEKKQQEKQKPTPRFKRREPDSLPTNTRSDEELILVHRVDHARDSKQHHDELTKDLPFYEL
jgi:hypothetical protein